VCVFNTFWYSTATRSEWRVVHVRTSRSVSVVSRQEPSLSVPAVRASRVDTEAPGAVRRRTRCVPGDCELDQRSTRRALASRRQTPASGSVPTHSTRPTGEGGTGSRVALQQPRVHGASLGSLQVRISLPRRLHTNYRTLMRCDNIYRVAQKISHEILPLSLLNIDRFSKIFHSCILWKIGIPPHLNCVATLPCEI